jgi:hypothetical protein
LPLSNFCFLPLSHLLPPWPLLLDISFALCPTAFPLHPSLCSCLDLLCVWGGGFGESVRCVIVCFCCMGWFSRITQTCACTYAHAFLPRVPLPLSPSFSPPLSPSLSPCLSLSLSLPLCPVRTGPRVNGGVQTLALGVHESAR